MLKKTVTYIDFDGKERTEDLYFNMTRNELISFSFNLPDVKTNFGPEPTKVEIEEAGKKMVEKMGSEGVFNFVKDLVFKAYGIKSEDGRRFIKSEQLSTEFTQTQAYDDFIMDLFSDDKKANDFINAIVPADMTNQMPMKALNGAN